GGARAGARLSGALLRQHLRRALGVQDDILGTPRRGGVAPRIARHRATGSGSPPRGAAAQGWSRGETAGSGHRALSRQALMQVACESAALSKAAPRRGLVARLTALSHLPGAARWVPLTLSITLCCCNASELFSERSAARQA